MEIAYVLVKSEMTHEMDIMSDLLKIDQVKEAKGTFGLCDIFVKIEAASSLDIAEIITKQIRKTNQVISTITLSVILG